MIYIILGDGFEEIEAVTPCDLLMRAEAEVRYVGTEGIFVWGAHGIVIKSDMISTEVTPEAGDIFVIPGGLGGIECIARSPSCMELLSRAKACGARFAAICAGPKVLDQLGLLEGKNYTCFPGFQENIASGNYVGGLTCVDGELITANGPYAAFEFGFLLAEAAMGREAADALRADIIRE